MIKIDRKKLEEIRDYISWEEPDRQGIDLCEYLELLINPAPEMTEADWQRIIDENFLIRLDNGTYSPLHWKAPYELSFQPAYGYKMSKVPDIVREKGIRQPHFQGHPHPEGKVLVEVYNRHNRTPERMYADKIDWGVVAEYILL